MGYIAKPNVRRGTEVKKGWGKEIIIENNDQYCGKLLIFNKGFGRLLTLANFNFKFQLQFQI